MLSTSTFANSIDDPIHISSTVWDDVLHVVVKLSSSGVLLSPERMTLVALYGTLDYHGDRFPVGSTCCFPRDPHAGAEVLCGYKSSKKAIKRTRTSRTGNACMSWRPDTFSDLHKKECAQCKGSCRLKSINRSWLGNLLAQIFSNKKVRSWTTAYALILLDRISEDEDLLSQQRRIRPLMCINSFPLLSERKHLNSFGRVVIIEDQDWDISSVVSYFINRAISLQKLRHLSRPSVLYIEICRSRYSLNYPYIAVWEVVHPLHGNASGTFLKSFYLGGERLEKIPLDTNKSSKN